MSPRVVGLAALGSLLALPAEAADGVLQRFWGDGHFNYGTAIVRGAHPGDEGCASADVVVATGQDHEPDFAARLFAGTVAGCMPNTEDTNRFSIDALHYSAVASADFCLDRSDEVVLATLAGADSEFGFGQLRLASVDRRSVLSAELEVSTAHLGRREEYCAEGDQCWREFVVAGPMSVLSVAIGDLDLDGYLDIVAGLGGFPSGALDFEGGEARAMNVQTLHGPDLVGPTLVFFGKTTESGTDCVLSFEAPVALAARGVTAARIQDVDRDGLPDLVLAGRGVSLVRGAGGRTFHPPVELLPQEESLPDAYQWLDVDVLARGDATYVAASRSCFSLDECAALIAAHEPMGVDLWRIAPSARPPRSVFTPVDGVPGATRFVEADDTPGPDLLVGMMLSAAPAGGCGERPSVGGYCAGGAPLYSSLGKAGLRFLAIDAGDASPMVVRAEPFAFDGSPSKCAPVRAGRGFATYTGDHTPVGATLYASSCPARGAPTDPIATHFVPGQRFASSAEPLRKVRSVVWSEATSPPILLSNAFAEPRGGNHVLNPPIPR